MERYTSILYLFKTSIGSLQICRVSERKILFPVPDNHLEFIILFVGDSLSPGEDGGGGQRVPGAGDEELRVQRHQDTAVRYIDYSCS